MAKQKRDADLFDVLRNSGVRKKVAKTLSDSRGRARGGRQDSLARAVHGLREAASELEKRVSGSSRTEAAKKAARTRKRNASKRSASAKKAARTRARRG